MNFIQGTLFVFSCFIILIVVAPRPRRIPSRVDHPDVQCRKKGHLTSCDNMNSDANGFINCRKLYCAKRPSRQQPTPLYFHTAVSIVAADGTQCGPENICRGGECIPLKRGRSMPIEGEGLPYKVGCTQE